MDTATLRRAIANEAARLLDRRDESDYVAAKCRAARRFLGDRRPDRDELPSNAEIRQLIQALEHAREHPPANPYAKYAALLRPLEGVDQRPDVHPEGDALYHSLQVFELAKDRRPFDVEFLLAALLHDVGKAIDPHDHVAAGLDALDGLISDRTRFFIEREADALSYRDGTLTAKKRDRLQSHPDFDELLLLAELDLAGRVPGAAVGNVDEAIDAIRKLEAES